MEFGIVKKKSGTFVHIRRPDTRDVTIPYVMTARLACSCLLCLAEKCPVNFKCEMSILFVGWFLTDIESRCT